MGQNVLLMVGSKRLSALELHSTLSCALVSLQQAWGSGLRVRANHALLSLPLLLQTSAPTLRLLVELQLSCNFPVGLLVPPQRSFLISKQLRIPRFRLEGGYALLALELNKFNSHSQGESFFTQTFRKQFQSKS